jgi:hypothetical protein
LPPNLTRVVFPSLLLISFITHQWRPPPSSELPSHSEKSPVQFKVRRIERASKNQNANENH